MTAEQKPDTGQYQHMRSSVRLPKEKLALAFGLQLRGCTLREIAMHLNVSVLPVQNSLYWDILK